MMTRAWIVLPLLAGAWATATAEEPAPPTDTPAPAFDLRTDAVRKIVRDSARAAAPSNDLASDAKQDVPAEAVRIADIASNLGKAVDPNPRGAPYSTDCRGDTCFRYDADGEVIFAAPRDLRREADPNVRIVKYECLGKSNLLDTFQRESRCNGIGESLPTPWDPLESLAPVGDRP